MGTIVEVHHDKEGIIWPVSVAPYEVHLIGLNLDSPEIHAKAKMVYEDLQKKRIEVIFDDRQEVSAGQKFAEADLMGIPFRLVISAKTGNKIEYKARDQAKAEIIEFPQVVERLKSLAK
jgi:prolyl-tRNA synthetase